MGPPEGSAVTGRSMGMESEDCKASMKLVSFGLRGRQLSMANRHICRGKEGIAEV